MYIENQATFIGVVLALLTDKIPLKVSGLVYFIVIVDATIPMKDIYVALVNKQIKTKTLILY